MVVILLWAWSFGLMAEYLEVVGFSARWSLLVWNIELWMFSWFLILSITNLSCWLNTSFPLVLSVEIDGAHWYWVLQSNNLKLNYGVVNITNYPWPLNSVTISRVVMEWKLCSTQHWNGCICHSFKTVQHTYHCYCCVGKL